MSTNCLFELPYSSGHLIAWVNRRHLETLPPVSRAKWRLRNERRNCILMTRHYRDLGSASGWLNQISHAARPVRSTTQIWVVTRHQYGISALVSQTSFGRETSGSVAKCRLFSQASHLTMRCASSLLKQPLHVIESKKSWSLVSMPWTPDSRYEIPGFFVSGTWIPDSLSCNPDSKAQNSCFYKQKFSAFRNPLHGLDPGKLKQSSPV